LQLDSFQVTMIRFSPAGEFFTPREVVRLLIELVEPKQGMKICDPTCGSGGMLIWSAKYVHEHGNQDKLVAAVYPSTSMYIMTIQLA
jgi:type I restriction-modification system DNA methylase subunit